MHPTLEKLKEEVDRLQTLLANPHPGLNTWNEMVANRWKAISKLWEDEIK